VVVLEDEVDELLVLEDVEVELEVLDEVLDDEDVVELVVVVTKELYFHPEVVPSVFM